MRLRFGVWLVGFFCFAVVEALMQMTATTGTKQCSSLLRKQKLVVKCDYSSLNGEVSKWHGLSKGSPYKHWEENSTSRQQFIACLPAMDLWQTWILSGQPRWGESQCFRAELIQSRTSVFTSQPLKSELEIFFCSIGPANHEKKTLLLITIFLLLKIKVYLKCQDGLPCTQGFRNPVPPEIQVLLSDFWFPEIFGVV